MMYWHEAKRFKQDQFWVVWDWCYEDSPLRDQFAESACEIEDMVDRCRRHIDTHYIARVRFFYNGVEMGSTALGNCYASGCDPVDDMCAGLNGCMDDLMEEAESEARERCVEMLDQLERDFR